jgi:hypothetical protein
LSTGNLLQILPVLVELHLCLQIQVGVKLVKKEDVGTPDTVSFEESANILFV